MERTKREYYNNCMIAIIAVSIFTSVGMLMLHKYLLPWEILRTVGIYVLVAISSAIAVYVMVMLIRYRGIKRYVSRRKLISSLEQNLIAIGAYEKKDSLNYVLLPVMKITDNTIRIALRNVKIRAAIEKYMGSFSTALPERYVVEDYYIAENNNELIIQYEDIKNYKRETYTLAEYKDKVKKLGLLDFYYDKKHIVNMNDYPHWIISGTTGSGKSYFVNELVIQAIIKEWEVVVLDLKRSYGLFQKHIDYVYEIDDILNKLLEIEAEMHARLKKLQPELDKNPRTLAVDLGCYKPKLIILEEFIALQSAYTKKEKEELERVVKSISVLARQSNIHLMIVMQAAGTENIQATTRHNFSKVLLGNCQSNIWNSTFGNGVDIPNVNGRLNKGEGLIQLDRINILRVPTISNMEDFY